MFEHWAFELAKALERKKELEKHYYFVRNEGLCFYPFTIKNNYGIKVFTPEEWDTICGLANFWVGRN